MCAISYSGSDRPNLPASLHFDDEFVNRLGPISLAMCAETSDARIGAWVGSLVGRKPTRLVTFAIANKTARTAGAMLVRREDDRACATV